MSTIEPSDPSSAEFDELRRSTLAAVAPGTQLREGLERILRGNTGALIVLGHDKVVESMCTGGFVLDVEFSATRLRELAKMDGAIVMDREATKIVRAAVHLMPDSSIPTSESGTRHRTADRVSRQVTLPVISVSQSMHLIAVYISGVRYVLEDSGAVLTRANQALATLERYKLRLDEVSGTLSALEIEDLVTLRDVAQIRPTFKQITYAFGDGTSTTTTSMGGVYPNGDVTHAYNNPGTMTVSANARYGGQFRLGGGAWVDIPGTTNIAGPAQQLQVVTAKNRLVNE